MQTYLCSTCNRKVRRADLLEHRKTCGGDLSLTHSRRRKFKQGFKTFLWLLSAGALGTLSIFLGRSSFQSLANMRQLERVPASSIRAALPGEVNLNGRAKRLDTFLTAPKTQRNCLYYRYVVERRERDSDGDTTWVTEVDRKAFVPFLLRDETGDVEIHPDDGVDFSVEESWSTRQGDRRYTEYRIDPGQALFVFGFAEREGDALQIVFDRPGHYQPILSDKSETAERVGMAGGSIAKAWFGLVSLAVALSVMIHLLRQHRLLVYFTILNLVVAIYLLALGFEMMKTDLQAATQRLQQVNQTVTTEVKNQLQANGVSWQGDWEALLAFRSYPALSSEEQLRLQEIRLNLAKAIERVRMQRGAFPEKWLAPLWRIPNPRPLPLPDADLLQQLEESVQPEKAKLPPLIGWILIGVSLLTSVVGYCFGFRKVKFKRCMENLPTSATQGTAYGLTELKGVVDLPETAELLKGPLSHQPCVQYHYRVQERRGSGKNAKWVDIINETQRIPFLCRDGEGQLLVDPADATLYTSHHSHKRKGRLRYTETRLEHGDPLYAIGECRIHPAKGDSLYLCKPEDRAYPFILSNLNESQVMRRIARAGIALLNVSFAGVLLLALLLFGLTGSFAATDYLAAALAAPIFMSAVTLTLHYNDLIFLRERVRRNLSNIEVSLQKRKDLVPRLEAVAKACMYHERSLQEAVTRMRNHCANPAASTVAGMQEYMSAEHGLLRQLLVQVEAMPDLISNTQTALLMRTLIVLENEISLMRNGFNDAVETYNTRIQVFPDMLFARLFHFEEQAFAFAETEITRIPPSLQRLWESTQVSELPAVEEDDLAHPASDTQSATAMELAAASAADSSASDVECLPTAATAFLTLLREPAKDDWETFRKAEALYPALKSLSPPEYRSWKTQVLQEMESDEIITVLEFSMQASIRRHLDPVFGIQRKRPIRHTDFSTMLDPVSSLLSLFAMLEETIETREQVFQSGIQNLNHPAASDFHFQTVDPDQLAHLDDVLEDIAHAAPMHRANILYACEAMVTLHGDATLRQCLMLCAVADNLGRKRPAFLENPCP